MPTHDIIVVGGSAGSLSALTALLRDLPDDLAAAVFVAIHSSPMGPAMLPTILARSSKLPVMYATDGQRIKRGGVLVAPPDLHLLMENDRVVLTKGPRENRFRPSIDRLFRSAAEAYGSRVVALVLSGMLDDGTYGLMAVKQRGGLAIVQDRNEAAYAGMPLSALRRVAVDHELPVAEIPALLCGLVGVTRKRGGAGRALRAKPASRGRSRTTSFEGSPAVYACPDCGGSLWEHDDQGLLRFRCRVGHGYTEESLVAAQDERLEDAMWTALRALEESAAMRRRMADRVASRGLAEIARGYRERADAAEQQASSIRRILERGVARGADVELVASASRRAPRRRAAQVRTKKVRRPRRSERSS